MPVTINIELEGTEEEVAAFLTELTGHLHTPPPKPTVTKPDRRLAEANRNYPKALLPGQNT